MDEIGHQIQRYLGVQVLTSVLVGVLSGLAFWAIGLENAAVWGVVAGVLNLVPYIGAIVTTAGTTLVAFLQFGTVGMALAVSLGGCCSGVGCGVAGVSCSDCRS